MSFPTADIEHVRHEEGRPLIGLGLPDGRQVVCARTRVGSVTGWACITPTSSEDEVRATMSSDGKQLTALMADQYDAFSVGSDLRIGVA